MALVQVSAPLKRRRWQDPPPKRRPVATWFPNWTGETVILVASGPSAKTVPLDIAKGRAKVIAINNSWRLAPWADVLYGCDFIWWRTHNGVPEFKGMKVSQDGKCARHYRDIRLVTCVRSYDQTTFLKMDEDGVIGWGGNSGFHALNLAVQFRARKFILVGYDMRLDLGLHWHGHHPRGLHNPVAPKVEKWRATLDAAKPFLDRLGAVVINCSPVSALTAYPKMSLQEALDS